MAAMTAEQAAEAGKLLDFAKVWAMFEKVSVQQAENAEQFKQMEARDEKRRAEEDVRQAKLAAMMAETDKKIKDLSDNIGGVNNTLGKITEAMVSCNVWRKFRPLGYTFSTASQNRVFYENEKRLAEADFFLEDGNYVMPIETKTTLEIEDVNKHLVRISKIRRYMDSRGDKRKIVAALAGAVVPQKTLDYAHENGIYVLVLNGENLEVTDGGENFIAKEW